MTVSKWERGLLAPTAHQRTLLRALGADAGGRSVQDVASELAGLLASAYIEVSEVEEMKLSASNTLRGKVVELDVGPVSTRVVVQIAPRVKVTSVITTASARRLGLKEGKPVTAVVKATDVILGTR
jgi:molybdopterin-binding protein